MLRKTVRLDAGCRTREHPATSARVCADVPVQASAGLIAGVTNAVVELAGAWSEPGRGPCPLPCASSRPPTPWLRAVGST
jgi:hypothetical protein